MTERYEEHVVAELAALSRLADAVAERQAGQVAALAELVTERLAEGSKLLFCGNGGSAADAQHLAAEYVVRFRSVRRALPAVALTTDTSVLTAAANDDGFDTVFARQVEALGRAGDVLVLHSTSGHSPNLLAAAESGRAAGLITVALLAKDGGTLMERVDHALVVPTDDTARAQELQMAIGHVVCDLVERGLAARSRA